MINQFLFGHELLIHIIKQSFLEKMGEISLVFCFLLNKHFVPYDKNK